MTKKPTRIDDHYLVTFNRPHEFSPLSSPRSLSQWERAIVLRAVGPDTLLAYLKVTEICESCPSVIVEQAHEAPVLLDRNGAAAFGVLGEGYVGRDLDGVPIVVNVHVRHGRIAEIEVVRMDGGVLQALPAIEDLSELGPPDEHGVTSFSANS